MARAGRSCSCMAGRWIATSRSSLREDLRDAPWLAADLSRPAGHGPVGGQGRASQPGRRAGGPAGLHRSGAARPVRARRHVGSAPIWRAPSPRAAGPRIAGLLLRVPCIFAEDARRTLPPFQALVREILMATLGPGAGCRRRPDPDAAYAEAVKHKDDRGGRSRPSRPRRRSPTRSAPIPGATAFPSIWSRWRRRSRSRR